EPLRKILMYYSAIYDEETGQSLPAEQQKAYLQRSADAARRMQRLIDDLLTYSRVVGTDLTFEQVDLNSLVAEVVAQFQDSIDQLNATVRWERLPSVKGITFQLRQLFANLMGNSIKYRSANRPLCITISVTPVRIPEMADVYGSERFQRVDFRDNGIG